jgi:hypothetical protein
VILMNLGRPTARLLVERWLDAFKASATNACRARPTGLQGEHDQDLLQQILRTSPEIAAAVHVESMDVLNSRHARFVRQHLRAQTANFEARLAAITDDCPRAPSRATRSQVPVFPPETRWRGRLAHTPGPEPALIERPVLSSPPPPLLVDRIVAAWAARPGDARVAPNQARFAAALTAGDTAAIVEQLAGIGRAEVGQGLLGGRRQHQRAGDTVFARQLALWTHDKLVSLAEAVGVLPLENPEDGPWGKNVRRPAAELMERIGEALAADLTPPTHVGGYLGIAADPASSSISASSTRSTPHGGCAR